ncbi:DUF2614 family zinc ribbon-containing protein [Paenibacillus glucanolyticus]|uniref:DUF2614 family zinc ribbon-containing protein n=1 Tax=Paenibacillus glucanolyticus TaxID=59843 RepID=UPI00128B95E1|nr:hypothetical protein [Paenibacillus glucanolyticus]
MFFLILIALLGLPIAIIIIYKSVQSVAALSRPSIECPVCGRNISIVGKTPRCYKCHSPLILHANGEYIKR